jgi:hypothetical protein
LGQLLFIYLFLFLQIGPGIDFISIRLLLGLILTGQAKIIFPSFLLRVGPGMRSLLFFLGQVYIRVGLLVAWAQVFIFCNWVVFSILAVALGRQIFLRLVPKEGKAQMRSIISHFNLILQMLSDHQVIR